MLKPILQLQHVLQRHRSMLPWVVLRRCVGRWCRVDTLILLRKPLHESAGAARPRLAGLSIRLLTSPQDPLRQQLCREHPQKGFDLRFQQAGHYCWVVLHQQQIVAYAWLATAPLAITEVACRYLPARGDCCIYDCFVADGFRGVGLYPWLLTSVMHDCAAFDSGLMHACIGVAATNQASRRGIHKAGFAEIGRIRHLRCWNRQWWWGLQPAGNVAAAR